MSFQSILYLPSQNIEHPLIYLLCWTPLYLEPCEFRSRYNFHSDSRIREFIQKSLLPIPLCACLRYENESTERVLKKPSGRACFQSLKLHREKSVDIHYGERARDSEMQIGRRSSV
ncbi:hypothetical protein CDAR_575571 [Caerostris darwini]|uniref:Uncharacterized protein n=1 Tax=Caerostris darwini TaxID=1538125 RepID=A0AAV4U3N5_9ARAC|nr:hypothetical protein CDAR_575571 [Caerostris darwini]